MCHRRARGAFGAGWSAGDASAAGALAAGRTAVAGRPPGGPDKQLGERRRF